MKSDPFCISVLNSVCYLSWRHIFDALVDVTLSFENSLIRLAIEHCFYEHWILDNVAGKLEFTAWEQTMRISEAAHPSSLISALVNYHNIIVKLATSALSYGPRREKTYFFEREQHTILCIRAGWSAPLLFVPCWLWYLHVSLLHRKFWYSSWAAGLRTTLLRIPKTCFLETMTHMLFFNASVCYWADRLGSLPMLQIPKT